MNKRIKKKRIKMENKRLCKRYPFLRPRNRFDDIIMWEHPKWDWRYARPYEWTELDAMPDGWRKAFGKQMCEEIRNALIEENYLYKYRIVQIKEKYGSLRWYDWASSKKVQDIIDKYEEISARTCICCGRPATKISKGWISPFCDRCAGKLSDRIQFKEIDDVNN